MPDTLPSISIIIPTFNESGFIVDCIKSLTLGAYPCEKIEVLVVDGGSTDDTAVQVRSLSGASLNIKLLDNPKKITPAAMNIGINAASNELLMWCGAHAVYDKDYVINSVTTLLDEPQAGSVGGVISPIAKTTTGKAISIATSSVFGIGNAQYRYAKERQQVDTVFGGCFFKKNILKVGGFNEAWVRNQDYELNYRLRSQIGPIILEPSIRCKYYCRESISKLSKQYFEYGFWRFNTLVEHPASFTYRQAAPVLLCLGLALSMVLIGFGVAAGWLLPLIYASASVLSATTLAIQNKKIQLVGYLTIIFPVLHLSWGAGFIKKATLELINYTLSKSRNT